MARLFAIAAIALLGIAPRIYVGPNIRVSADSEKSHFEPMVASAANNVLIAASNLTGGDDNAWITKGYVSRDGGSHWFSVWLPRLIGTDRDLPIVSGDSAVAAGARGRILYAALCWRFNGRERMLVTCLYRSDDRGHSWAGPTILDIADHERFVSDPARGFIALAGKWAGKQDRLVLYVSRDNGTTFANPLTYARVLGIAFDPCLLPGGALFLPFLSELKTGSTLEGVVMSRNQRVSQPIALERTRLSSYHALMTRAALRIEAGAYADEALPVFLAYRGRLFWIGTRMAGGAFHVFLRVSRDSGRHWSKARLVAANADRDQFAPAATFNARGVLGIVWSQMTSRVAYDERFTASLDGGLTFFPARVVSSRDSMPFDDENIAGGADVDPRHGQFFQASGFTTRSSGGDYFAIAADDAGAFHPVWIDSRDGVGAQLYTSSVWILDRRPSCSASGSAPVSLAKTVKIVFDPMQMDVRTDTLLFSIRLQNDGSSAIAPPITLTVTALQADENILPKVAVPAVDMPRIIGAVNGKAGAGATFDFSHSLGDLRELPPAAVSDAVELRVRVHNPLMTEPVITASVSGRTCGS